MKVVLTGSSGFVGGALLRRLKELDADVLTVGRRAGSEIDMTHDKLVGPDAQWGALQGRQALLHVGARVHVMREESLQPMAAYRHANVHHTTALAQAAVRAGIKRLVFVSSVKVCGEETGLGEPFRHDGPARAIDPYGISKQEAEQGLRQIAAETGLEVVIIRPPLVYGPGVKANFAAMMRAVQRGIPLPLASVTRNRRSFVALDNLVDLLITCIDHPAAANQTFLVSDGEDLSTADLLRRLGRAMNQPARLFPAPPSLLQFAANLMGKGAAAQRLLGNLQVDIEHTRTTLDWAPPLTVDEGLRRAAGRVR